MTFALTLGSTPRVDVLVVDDNPFMRAAVTRILQRRGRRCVAVGSLDAAKMTLLEHRPLFVLTDYSLGIRETGIDLLRWIRAQPGLEDLRCGLMSGSDRQEIAAALVEAGLGSLPVLEKPFGLAELELWIDSLLPRGASPRSARHVP
jgi:CheY-like chemotaxis protein